MFGEGGYETETFTLGPGDALLCFTDGATEIPGRDGDILDTNGLAELAAPHVGRENGLETLYRELKQRCCEVQLPDDVLLHLGRDVECSVGLINRMGGNMMKVDDVVKAARAMMGVGQ